WVARRKKPFRRPWSREQAQQGSPQNSLSILQRLIYQISRHTSRQGGRLRGIGNDLFRETWPLPLHKLYRGIICTQVRFRHHTRVESLQAPKAKMSGKVTGKFVYSHEEKRHVSVKVKHATATHKCKPGGL